MVGLLRLTHHHAAARARTNDLTALIDALVFKGDDTAVGFGLALPFVDNHGLGRNRVANEDRIRKGGFIEAQVAQRCSQAAPRATSD